MAYSLTLEKKQNLVKTIVFDILAISFIYFVPTLSHLTSLPIYLIEPMRIMLILSLAHTRKQNAYLLALTLPLFSFLISSHPVLPKMLLISAELIINAFLFILLSKAMKNIFLTSLISIVASKLVYYSAKFILISAMVLDSQLVSTPIIIQIVVTIGLSLYLFFVIKKNPKELV